jgi:hypothetical protein
VNICQRISTAFWYALSRKAVKVARRRVLRIATICEEWRTPDGDWAARLDSQQPEDAERLYREYREALDLNADFAEEYTYARSAR